MNLSCGNFYKTIEEAETAIKQYSKEHYFICLNRPQQIKNLYSSGMANGPRRIKIILFVGNRPPTNKENFMYRESSPMNKKNYIRRESSE